jgi:hypothetical protein
MASGLGMQRFWRGGLGVLSGVITVGLALSAAWAADAPRYPDLKGRWLRTGAANFDPGKPPGLGQQAPLIPEYQAILAKSVADQKAGGQGNNPMARCLPPGMPRMMLVYGLGMEIVVADADTTYILFSEPMNQLRRIYTDGRAWPEKIPAGFSGYSIGRWEDQDPSGRFQTLAIETRGMRAPRSYDQSGMPFHVDGRAVVNERIYLDKADPEILYDDLTVTDSALTRPWSVKRTYRREAHPVWLETICGEEEHQLRIGGQDYFVSGTGYLMPTRPDQPPPDLKNFTAR